MSKYQGGMIGSVANTTSGTAYTGRANGVFPLPQQIVAKNSSLWAIGQTRPNPPTIGTATGTGATTISVAFIPPVQNGGSAITSYTVTSSGGQTATGSSSPIVVSGLTTGTSYTFTVTATNALGTSDSSGTSNSVQPAITDPSFSSVSLLLNGDGTNGSQVFTDLSSSPKAITAYGNAQISTAVKKYGTGAIAFNGSSDILTIPATASLNFGTGDFTIECWFNCTAFNSTILCSNGYYTIGNNGNYNFRITSATQIAFAIYDGQSSVDYTEYTAPSISLNTWYHIAVVRKSGNFSIYLNGTSIISKTLAASLPDAGVNGLTIGRTNYSGGTQYFNGYIDDFRITKGIARYTTNFTPPTAPLPTL